MSVLALKRLCSQALVVSALLASVPLTSSPAYADRTGGWEVRKARTADHFRFAGEYDKLLKIPHPAEWRNGELFIVSHDERKPFAEGTRRIADRLRSDSGFLARFGRIVPKVSLEHESWILQGSRSGADFESLSSKKQKVAKEEMAAAVAMAGELVGNVSADPSRFVFDSSNGKITGWYAMPPAPKGKAAGFSLVETIGEGANARVYKVRSTDPELKAFQVIKILKPYAPRRTPEEAPLPVLQALSREAEYLSDAMARDPAFARRFGSIIPPTAAIAPGVIAQALAKGESFHSLDSDAQLKAREEIKDLVEMAKRIAPGVLVTARPQNYLFTKSGEIATFYDIASDGHKAYLKAGLKERVFAHKHPDRRGESQSHSDSDE